MPTINKENSLLIRCTCHGHILEVENDAFGLLDEGGEPWFSVTVWNQNPNPIGLKYRLKLIWDLIRGRSLDGGDVILTQSDARQLVSFLNKKISENNVAIKNRKKK